MKMASGNTTPSPGAVLFGLVCLYFSILSQSAAFSTTSSSTLATRQNRHMWSKKPHPISTTSIHHRQSPPSSYYDVFHHGSSRRTKLQAFQALPDIWVTSFLPPFLGLIKSEWGVSYGYGFAVALSAMNVLYRATRLTTQQPNPVIFYHASALIFFGLRLNAFLFIRTRLSPRMKHFQETVEERAAARGSRLKRLPFIVTCGFLYFGLVCPLILTSRLLSGSTNVLPLFALEVMKILVAGQWFGYLLAALGDLTKSYVKLKNKDEKFLVTEGVYSLTRHPNYSGEIIGWTCNACAGTLAGAYILRTVRPVSASVIATMATSVLGWIGIVFVLLRSTTSLEKKQKEEYGGSSKYQEWVSSSWSGWTLQDFQSKSSTQEEHHEITMDAGTEEDYGSGI